MGHLQGIEDCSEVRIFRPCIPRINIKNIKPPFFRKHLNVSDDEERTCSWTPRYRFLLIRVCQWWMLDQSPSKIQRSRVQSDRVGLHSTSYAPWLMTDIIEGILTENVRTVMLNTDHQHKSYIWGNPGDCSGSFFFWLPGSPHGRCLSVSHEAQLQRWQRHARVFKAGAPAQSVRPEKRNLTSWSWTSKLKTNKITTELLKQLILMSQPVNTSATINFTCDVILITVAEKTSRPTELRNSTLWAGHWVRL